MTSARAYCGVCGLLRMWQYTALWFDHGGKRAVVQARAGGIEAEGYPDDHAELVIVPATRFLYVPICQRWCAEVATALTGATVSRETPRAAAHRARLRAVLPPWWRPEAEKAAEQGRAA